MVLHPSVTVFTFMVVLLVHGVKGASVNTNAQSVSPERSSTPLPSPQPSSSPTPPPPPLQTPSPPAMLEGRRVVGGQEAALGDFEYVVDGSFPVRVLVTRPAIVSPNSLTPGTPCSLAGWGSTVAHLSEHSFDSTTDVFPDVLNHVSIPLLPTSTCQALYGDVRMQPERLCAGYLAGGKDGCVGDSGSPLVCDGQLVGLMSAGAGCAQALRPGVYLNISHYHHWIHRTVRRSYNEERAQRKKQLNPRDDTKHYEHSNRHEKHNAVDGTASQQQSPKQCDVRSPQNGKDCVRTSSSVTDTTSSTTISVASKRADLSHSLCRGRKVAVMTSHHHHHHRRHPHCCHHLHHHHHRLRCHHLLRSQSAQRRCCRLRCHRHSHLHRCHRRSVPSATPSPLTPATPPPASERNISSLNLGLPSVLVSSDLS